MLEMNKVHRKEKRGTVIERHKIRERKFRIQGEPWRSGATGADEGGSIGIQGRGEEVTERGERRSENQKYKTEGFSRL